MVLLLAGREKEEELKASIIALPRTWVFILRETLLWRSFTPPARDSNIGVREETSGLWYEGAGAAW